MIYGGDRVSFDSNIPGLLRLSLCVFTYIYDFHMWFGVYVYSMNCRLDPTTSWCKANLQVCRHPHVADATQLLLLNTLPRLVILSGQADTRSLYLLPIHPGPDAHPCMLPLCLHFPYYLVCYLYPRSLVSLATQDRVRAKTEKARRTSLRSPFLCAISNAFSSFVILSVVVGTDGEEVTGDIVCSFVVEDTRRRLG